MYTGLISAVGMVTEIIDNPGLRSYSVRCPDGFLKDVTLGASINIDGVCQTVVDFDAQTVWFDAMTETLNKTTIKDYRPDQAVHLERSAKFGDEIGGHILSGHVFGTATVVKVEQDSAETKILTFECDSTIAKYLFPKGFIAIDGASLTLVKAEQNQFSVHLIPQTLKLTHFDSKQVGSKVNIEIDAQTLTTVTTVERWIAHQQTKS